MGQITEVFLPDIGDFSDVEVIEVLVSAGDPIQAEDSLITLESEKATMEIPSPHAGTVKEVKVETGDKINKGQLLLLMEIPEKGEPAPEPPIPEAAEVDQAAELAPEPEEPPPAVIPDEPPAARPGEKEPQSRPVIAKPSDAPQPQSPCQPGGAPFRP